MKLSKIHLIGYKSIDDITFDITKIDTSYTKIFIGKNETGKSSILEAMAFANTLEKRTPIDFIRLQNQETQPEYIDAYYTMIPEDKSYLEPIKDAIDIEEDLLNKIELLSATKNVFASDIDEEDDEENENSLESMWSIKLKEFPLKDIYYKKTASDTDNKKYIFKGKTELTEEELTNYSLLDWKKFTEIVCETITQWLEHNEVKVDVWKPEPGYLIQNEVNLDDFYNTPANYPLLTNVFKICGYTTRDDIRSKIDTIKRNSNRRRNLETELSKKITEYLNKKWKEHANISIDVRIENTIMLKVQDKDKKDNFHNPSERSDGFKQFVSLLLSISADNEVGTLKNKLILIDEPEIHLHPSGIRDMLKELLLLGKNNYVFVSTHSNFMLDSNSKERHYIVTKKKGITEVKPIKSEDDLNDDEILQAAFGINIMQDFLSPHKLLVEGLSDKKIIQKALKKLNPTNDILITNGRGDSIKPEASIMNYHNITQIMVVVDDDVAGKGYKDEIVAIGGNFSETNVFTIRELNGNICDKGTIEDCLPLDYVEGKFNEILHDRNLPDIALEENSPFCSQLKLHIQTNTPALNDRATKAEKLARQQEIDSIIKEIKTKIAEDFNDNIEAPKLSALAEAIFDHFHIPLD